MISIPVIITLAVMVLLALVMPLFSPFFRKVEPEYGDDEEGDTAANQLPPVSIVLAEHDCSHYLKKVLPLYLSQDYGADYQVVVVIDQSDTESEDYLKLLCEEHKQLYYTLLPDSSRYVSRKKLGMTLGIRAAKYEWLLFADVNCAPSSEKWLEAVARHCGDDRNMVLGMTPYEEDTPAYFRFEQMRTMLYHLRSAQKGMAFSTNQSLMMMRRSEFFDKRGFLGNLEFARAEFEFLVNKFAAEDKCAIAIEPEARMTQMEPSEEYIKMKRLFAIDALKGLSRSSGFKSLYKTDLYSIHVFNFLTLIVMVCGALLAYVQMTGIGKSQFDSLLPNVFMQYDGLALLGGAALAWLISLLERMYVYSNKLSYFDSVSPLAAIMMEWTISIRNTALRISYIFSDKTDFITHKL